MASKHPAGKGHKDRRAQTEPYAPPEHPDVNVPEQQFEGVSEEQQRKGKESRPHR